MSSRTALFLAVGLVIVAVGVVAYQWSSQPEPALPDDHAQIAPGDTFDDAATAVDYYRALLRREPESVDARIRLAHALLQLGTERGTQAETIPEARELLAQAVERDPESLYGRSLQASLFNVLHRFEEARDVSRDILADYPVNAYAMGTLVDALVELGEYDQAVEASDNLLALKPGLPAYSRASYLRELHGDTDGAIAAMRLAADAAVGGRPERAWALHHLAGLYLGDAKPDTAAFIYTGILEEKPDFAPALAGLGHVALVKGDADEAVRLLEEARALQPLEMIDELLVEAHLAAGNERAAEAAAQRVHAALLAARGFGEVVDMEEADFLADRDEDLKRVLRLAREQQARRPGHLHANETLAWALYKTGDATAAVPYIERAMRLDTGDAMVHYRAARIYDAAGDAGQAARHLSAALDGGLAVESPSTAAEARTLMASLEGETSVRATSAAR
ncbi:tetratricopeptide repeat protein [Rubrivirga sp. IMCC43871]|uniref:tetratricopeptide repeat protein n=1 Tax=Rubrivirga sp. IMCC43871 TaxID=3391575 RepID=UPI00398FDE54